VTLTADEARNKLAQEDREARLEAAFQQHWSRLYALLYRLVGDRAEAEDLALEVFWRLHRSPPRLADESRLGGWLYRVATHLGFNTLRARRRRQRYEIEAGSLVFEEHASNDPAGEAEKALERARVRKVLENMKPRAAQVLVLRHSGLTYAEIAAALGVAPSSVGTLLARAEQEFETRYLSDK